MSQIDQLAKDCRDCCLAMIDVVESNVPGAKDTIKMIAEKAALDGFNAAATTFPDLGVQQQLFAATTAALLVTQAMMHSLLETSD